MKFKRYLALLTAMLLSVSTCSFTAFADDDMIEQNEISTLTFDLNDYSSSSEKATMIIVESYAKSVLTVTDIVGDELMSTGNSYIEFSVANDFINGYYEKNISPAKMTDFEFTGTSLQPTKEAVDNYNAKTTTTTVKYTGKSGSEDAIFNEQLNYNGSANRSFRMPLSTDRNETNKFIMTAYHDKELGYAANDNDYSFSSAIAKMTFEIDGKYLDKTTTAADVVNAGFYKPNYTHQIDGLSIYTLVGFFSGDASSAVTSNEKAKLTVVATFSNSSFTVTDNVGDELNTDGNSYIEFGVNNIFIDGDYEKGISPAIMTDFEFTGTSLIPTTEYVDNYNAKSTVSTIKYTGNGQNTDSAIYDTQLDPEVAGSKSFKMPVTTVGINDHKFCMSAYHDADLGYTADANDYSFSAAVAKMTFEIDGTYLGKLTTVSDVAASGLTTPPYTHQIDGLPIYSVGAFTIAEPATPEKPAGVTVTPGDKSLTVKWNPVAGATKYYIYTYLNGKYTTVRTNFTGTSFTITGLTNGTKYGVLVRAFNDANWGSAFSANDLVYGTPSAPIAPSKPTGVTVTPGDKSLTVKWNPVAGATKYYIYTYLNGKYTTVRTNFTGTSFTITGLTNGTKYGVLVRAFNDANMGSAFTTADHIYGTPAAPASPAKPTGVTVTPGDKSLNVKWNPVPGASYYVIYKYLDGKYTAVKSNYTGTSYTIAGLTNGTRYGVLVRAFNSANVGSAFTTNDLVVGTPVAAAVVAKPTGVTVTPDNGVLKVKWNAVPGATKYYVYTYVNGQYTVRRTNLAATAYNITGLANGINYGVLVRAFNDANVGSAFTTADLVYGTPVAAPAKPAGVTVTPDDGVLKVKWNAVPGATKYYVYTYVNGQYTVRRTNLAATAYNITGLANGTNYGVLVRAFNSANVGSAFTTADLVYGTPVAAPAKPLVTVTTGDGSITASWAPVPGATKYYIYTYLNGQYTVRRANYTGTSITITGLTNGVNYGILVRAFNDNNVGSSFTTADLVYAAPKA